MLNYKQIKQLSNKVYKFKRYDKTGNLKYSYQDIVDFKRGPVNCTDIYFWIISGMPLEPTPVFSKTRSWRVPKIRIKPVIKINLWSKK